MKMAQFAIRPAYMAIRSSSSSSTAAPVAPSGPMPSIQQQKYAARRPRQILGEPGM